MDRNWLKGELGDAMHAVLCAAGYNIRWLMRAILAGLISPIYGSLIIGGLWMQIFKDRFVSLPWESAADSKMRLMWA